MIHKRAVFSFVVECDRCGSMTDPVVAVDLDMPDGWREERVYGERLLLCPKCRGGASGEA